MASVRNRPKKAEISYPMCVRHVKPRKDVRLRHFFLCGECTNKWVTEAFARDQPLYTGESLLGYCVLCNRKREVNLRTWFLCDICDRVARSIGRNHEAEKAILKFWSSHVASRYPHLEIVQNDPSSLRPRRSTDETGRAPLDFLVRDRASGEVLFGIENKTGRSSIKDMSQFQLDVSDCDSILNEVERVGAPVYLIHAQVLEDWLPPTLGYRTVGLWWTDIFQMAEHFSSLRMRRDEQRGAAYFKKAAFSPIETFCDGLYDQEGRLRLVGRFKRERAPKMYVIEE